MKTRLSIIALWDRAALAVSLALVLAALGVIVGWHAHIPVLVQVFPGLIPVQYNTALCFLALGAAGIGLVVGQRLLQGLAGGFVALMGLAVIMEYASGKSFGIDTLFFYPWVRSLSADPGRMALTTAAAFAFTGGAATFLALRPRADAVFGMANAIALSLGLTSLVGYAYRITYVIPFGLGSQMALVTSTAFLAHGAAMLGRAWVHAKRGQDGLPAWAAGMGIALLPAMFVGAGSLFAEQSWRATLLEALMSIAGVAVLTFAIRRLTTARVAYKGLIMVMVPLGLLLVFSSLVARAKQQSESAQAWAQHSSDVSVASRSLVAQITELESRVRGYVITRDGSFVDSYASLSRGVVQTSLELRGLVVDNPLQEASARRIADLAASKMDNLAHVVSVLEAQDEVAIREVVTTRRGIDMMSLMRAEMSDFSREEDRLSGERQLLLGDSWQRLNWLLVSGTASAILLAGILTVLFSGGIGLRLKRLRDNAIGLAAGHALEPPLGGDDEIAELDRTFHEMARSLDEVTARAETSRMLEGQTLDARHAEALLKTGALQSAIFNSANFSSIATDATGVIQIFNVGAERMLGYAAAEVMNKITPADISDPREVIARAEALSLELGTTITPGFEALVFKASRGIEDIYELTYIRKDGSRFPAVVSVTALRDAQDNIIGYLLIGTDNTARKKAEEALLQAGALQSAIFNSANFSSIATDARGVIQIFNVGAERMLGYAAADVMNKNTPADISDPQEVILRAQALSLEFGSTITPGFEALVFKASRGIEDIYELTYFRKDGSRFPAVVSVTALRDPQDNIIGYLLIGTDNTARKQVEAAQALLDQRLRDQQFYTRSLIESNIDALMTTDPQGIISDVNQQMIELTGRSRDELIGAPCRKFFTDPDRADAAIERVLAENRVSDYELTVRARNGKETVVSYNAATFHNRDRELQGVFAAARDVTEAKLIERTLEEKNVELEHASLMKSEFLATMSHELRTPLNAIIGFSEALQDGLVGKLSSIQQEYIGDIFTSGQHLLSLINDILDLSKVEAGMMALELEAVDVGNLLSNSLSIVREKAADHRIRLDLEVGEHLGWPQLDARKTKQIVYNLLSNAVKFTPNGGRVTVRARRVSRSTVGTLPGDWPVHSFELADSDFKEFLEISVRDTGIGISRVNMARLFQAFSQIDSSLARKFEGTGLGLAMVKQMTELHGGSVAVASTEGEGTLFAAWLPLHMLDVPVTTQLPRIFGDSAPGELESEERVALVVEDDDPAAELIRLLLEAEGFSVLRAASAEEGLRQAQRQALSLITLDIHLPGIDGWEFLLEIREIPNLAKVPVVIIAGVAENNLSLSRGAAAVLQKPISRAQLKISLANLGLQATEKHVRTILIVDDDPKAVEVIAAFLPAPAYAVVRAYGGSEAIALARRLQPDLILLDLMMPEVTGFDVVKTLQGHSDTDRIPILVVTAKQVTMHDKAQLNDNPGNVIHVVEKAGFNRSAFLAEVRRALVPH